MTEAIFRRRAASYVGEPGLFSVDEESANLLGTIKLGRDVGVDVKQRRNPRHHRLFFAILKFVREHSPTMSEVPIERLKTAVKIATGLVETYIDKESGETFYVPKSIAWAAMDQSEFGPWFDEACRVIAARWMPEGTTAESVRDELFAMVDGPQAVGRRVG